MTSLPIVEKLKFVQQEGISLTALLDKVIECNARKIDVIQLLNTALVKEENDSDQDQDDDDSVVFETNDAEFFAEDEEDTKVQECDADESMQERKSGEHFIPFTPVLRRKKKQNAHVSNNEKENERTYLGTIGKFNGLYGEFLIQGNGKALWFGVQHLTMSNISINIGHNFIYECKLGTNFDKKTNSYRPCATSITFIKRL